MSCMSIEPKDLVNTNGHTFSVKLVSTMYKVKREIYLKRSSTNTCNSSGAAIVFHGRATSS